MKNDLISSEDLKVMLLGEVILLELLSKALYYEPDRSWIEGLIAGELFTDAPFGMEQPETVRGLEVLHQWSQAHLNGLSEEDFSELKTDYLRLFIGLDVFPTAPWESVYFNRERLVLQEQTIQVRKWYARFGLQSEKLYKEPDDHIGLEILFVAHLASLALQAIEKSDQNSLDEILQAQRDFLSEHLLRWGSVWAKLVIKHAATDFYRGIAHLTHGSLLALADHLDIAMPQEARP